MALSRKPFCKKIFCNTKEDKFWEILNGVDVDGVGGNFLIIYISYFFFVLFVFTFLCFSPHSPRTRANNCNLLENGDFTPTPSAPTQYICSPPGLQQKQFSGEFLVPSDTKLLRK